MVGLMAKPPRLKRAAQDVTWADVLRGVRPDDFGEYREYFDFIGPGLRPEPTDALPGTEEKIDVMIERAANCESLTRTGDAELNDRQYYRAVKRPGWEANLRIYGVYEE